MRLGITVPTARAVPNVVTPSIQCLSRCLLIFTTALVTGVTAAYPIHELVRLVRTPTNDVDSKFSTGFVT